jgi:CRP-like cAMP-binding protein
MELTPYYFINAALTESPELNALVASATTEKYAGGEIIFHANQIPKGVYVLLKGKVKVFQRIPTGTDQVMNIHIAGEIIGYRAVVSNERYAVNATAIEPCSLAFIPKKDFVSLLESSPSFAQLLLRYLSREFTVWVNTVSILTHQTVKERLLLNLLILVIKYQDGSKWPVKLTLQKTDVASLIGTSKETLARVLKTLKEEGLIAAKGGRIQINNAIQFQKLQLQVILLL